MTDTEPVPLREAARVWARIALLSFGGPAGQIALMHRVLVEERRWLSEARFLHALNYCMLLPGPAIMVLSWIYAAAGDVGWVSALFFGLKAAVLAIVAEAVRRIGARALRNNVLRAIAAAAFVAIFFLGVPFPLIVLAAGAIGYLGGRAGAAAFSGGGGHGPEPAGETLLGDRIPGHAMPSLRWALRISAIFLLLWLAPLAVLYATAGPDSVFSKIGLFFSQMAVVTFGGAYAVLAYVAQQAVENYGWLEPGEMLDGLGMAETTPGPLIMVTQFVGFMAAYRDPGGLHPMAAGTMGGLLTTWVTFTPCFLWIFLGAPFVEKLRSNRGLTGALTAITAAVVGVILNLAIWFALHTLFREVREVSAGPLRFDLPAPASVDLPALALALAAMVAMFRFRLGAPVVLAGCAAAGMLWWAVGSP